MESDKGRSKPTPSKITPHGIRDILARNPQQPVQTSVIDEERQPVPEKARPLQSPVTSSSRRSTHKQSKRVWRPPTETDEHRVSSSADSRHNSPAAEMPTLTPEADSSSNPLQKLEAMLQRIEPGPLEGYQSRSNMPDDAGHVAPSQANTSQDPTSLGVTSRDAWSTGGCLLGVNSKLGVGGMITIRATERIKGRSNTEGFIKIRAHSSFSTPTTPAIPGALPWQSFFPNTQAAEQSSVPTLPATELDLSAEAATRQATPPTAQNSIGLLLRAAKALGKQDSEQSSTTTTEPTDGVDLLLRAAKALKKIQASSPSTSSAAQGEQEATRKRRSSPASPSSKSTTPGDSGQFSDVSSAATTPGTASSPSSSQPNPMKPTALWRKRLRDESRAEVQGAKVDRKSP